MTFDPVEFEWDEGNINKNSSKHQVSVQECEEVFADINKIILDDIEHSHRENRLIVIGYSQQQKLLIIAYTIRKQKIRVISARDVDRKERRLYEKTINTSQI